MTDFEDQLREALWPPDVPAGFKNRVLAKLPEAYPPAPRHPVMRRVAVWAAVVVVIAGSITGLQIERAQEQRVRGEKARERVMLALRITGTKLNQAQSHVRQVGDDGSTNGERP
jgi:hypothetical protein